MDWNGTTDRRRHNSFITHTQTRENNTHLDRIQSLRIPHCRRRRGHAPAGGRRWRRRREKRACSQSRSLPPKPCPLGGPRSTHKRDVLLQTHLYISSCWIWANRINLMLAELDFSKSPTAQVLDNGVLIHIHQSPNIICCDSRLSSLARRQGILTSRLDLVVQNFEMLHNVGASTCRPVPITAEAARGGGR